MKRKLYLMTMIALLSGCSYQEMAVRRCINDGLETGTDEFQNCVGSRVAYLEGDILLSAQKECFQYGKEEGTLEYQECVENGVIKLKKQKKESEEARKRLQIAILAAENNISIQEAELYYHNPHLLIQKNQQDKYLKQMDRINNNLNQLNYQMEQNRRKRYYGY